MSIRARTTRSSCASKASGWTSVAGERTKLHAGELVRWPPDTPHRLWTEGTAMTTVMYEQKL